MKAELDDKSTERALQYPIVTKLSHSLHTIVTLKRQYRFWF
jgi:hypothetical protein